MLVVVHVQTETVDVLVQVGRVRPRDVVLLAFVAVVPEPPNGVAVTAHAPWVPGAKDLSAKAPTGPKKAPDWSTRKRKKRKIVPDRKSSADDWQSR